MKTRLFLTLFLFTLYGQTSTLTANGYASGNAYLWENVTATANTNASFITSAFSAIIDGSYQSAGTNVTVTGGVTQTGSIAVTSALQTNNPRTRTFSFRLPNANPDCNRPLLIALHGDGGTGAGMMSSTGFNTVADAENFIVVYPNSSTVNGGVQWNKFADGVAGSGDNGNDANAADDEKFIADIIDYFYLNYGIDRSKVYITGHSGGGFMTYFLALSNQTKNKIAAIAPVAASLWGQNSYLNAQVASGTFVPTPVLHIHSTTDGTVPFPTLGGWTWPLASFSYSTCSSSAYTTAAISAVIDKHTFCNSPTPVILMGLKQAGLGHAWPTLTNSTYNASQEIWDFVKNHSKGSYAVPTPTISPSSISITSGNSTTLTASGCGALSVLWSSGQTTTTLTVSPTTTTNYTVRCRTTASNCQLGNVSASATVTVGGAGSLSTTANPSTICAGQTSSLSAVGCTGGIISWSNGQTGVGALVFPATTTTYTATCSTGGSSAVTVAVYPNNVVITTATYPNYTANQVVQASQTITTSSPPNIIITPLNSNKLNYQAGESITLSPGFSTQSGAVFSAKIGGCILATTPTMQVNGRFLYDANGQKIVLVGANLPILDDWDFPTSDKFLEYEKTGANVVRISWYMDYGQPTRPAYSLTDLDNFLTKCKTNKIIPVIDIHDYTCGSDISVLNSQIIPWWISAPVLAIINKHKKYLIINLANELGVYRWAGGGNEATALLNFKNAYKTAITTIRNAGIDVPIMIDAPDCGTTISAFNLIGTELVAHDPKNNLLLSAHAYWADYDGRPEISPAIANNLPIVFGEVANKQDEYINGATSYCYYDIDGTTANHVAATGFTYQNLMNTCQTNEIGTMVYAWNKDNCSSRQMSSTGNYINLTTFGNDIVNNATYGIKNKAVRSNAF